LAPVIPETQSSGVSTQLADLQHRLAYTRFAAHAEDALTQALPPSTIRLPIHHTIGWNQNTVSTNI
jgi:hypothetical protein